MSTATSALPAAAAAANEKTLTEAMASTSINENGTGEKSADGSDLEDGEIREEDEEDDGSAKTVFDDARRFNVKVSHASLRL